MRTTINIDDGLLAELKERAGDQPLTSVVNETLRRGLAATRSAGPATKQPFVQRTCSLGRPLIDLTKALSIADAMDDEERMARMARHSVPASPQDSHPNEQ